MERANRLLPMTCALLLALAPGCGSRKTDLAAAELEPLKSCADVEASIRSAAIAEMTRKLDESLRRYLEYYERWCTPYGKSYGNSAPPAGAPVPGSSNWTCSGSKCTQSGDSDPQAKAADHSKTNNQVAGVEEADMVKTDGTYLYLVAGKTLRVIRAWPPEKTEQLAEVAVEGTPGRLFVVGDRALVYSSLGSSSQKPCTYGYACDFIGDGHPTKITVLDLGDRRSPKVVRELTLSGSLISARRIGAAVHTVISAPGITFSDLEYHPERVRLCNEMSQLSILLAFEALRQKNVSKILETDLGGWLPTVFDTAVQGGKKNLLAQCGGFFRSSQESGGQFTTVLSLDMTGSSPATASTIVSRPGAVYGSRSALYISVPHQRTQSRWWYPSMSGQDEASTVHKFALESDPPRSRYLASGVVKGRVLNQFAMDERDGYLRIATTSGRVPSPNVHSTLTVLEQQGPALVQAGIVDKLAPREDIRSVRFAGDRGFIVTFKKTDPLFVIDLADPQHPEVLAELKIPGFSTYMHMMDDGHLLTIGYDADDQGSFAWFTGVMLQIFDVSTPTKPRLEHREVIGTRGSSSEALNNHLAFNYYAKRGLLALPITVCEGGSGGGSYGTQMTFSGLMVYDVAAGSGFKLRGKVDHKPSDAISCGNWWTNAASQVKRSIFMEDYVFSISEERVKVNRLDDLAEDISSLPVGAD
jgi:hypothetical protein